MATLIRDVIIAASADTVWASLRNPGAAADAFAGVLKSSTLNGDVRAVEFANGARIDEKIVTVDDAARRLAYHVIGGRFTHHNASMQCFDDGPNACRFLWTIDFLPSEAGAIVEPLMIAGCDALARRMST